MGSLTNIKAIFLLRVNLCSSIDEVLYSTVLLAGHVPEMSAELMQPNNSTGYDAARRCSCCSCCNSALLAAGWLLVAGAFFTSSYSVRLTGCCLMTVTRYDALRPACCVHGTRLAVGSLLVVARTLLGLTPSRATLGLCAPPSLAQLGRACRDDMTYLDDHGRLSLFSSLSV